LNQFLDPECLPGSLASGTMPVSTTVVRVTDGSAVFTSFLVAPKSSRTAVCDFPQDFQLQGSNPCFELIKGHQIPGLPEPDQTLCATLAEVIECIQRAVRLNQWTLGYMKVDHGGGYLCMAKQFFEGLRY
jgi:hypothetical protein